MVAVVVVAVLASLWNTMMLMIALPLWFLFMVSLIAWINSYLLRRVFTVFEQNEDDIEAGEKGEKYGGKQVKSRLRRQRQC